MGAQGVNAPDFKALLKDAYLSLEKLKARVDGLEREKSEPIAVVGIGCRLPGGADSADRYWELLRQGVDAIREVPRDRWDIDAYYDPNPDAPEKMYTRWGGFIGRVDGFDAPFFGISPREAETMDPQQRLVLEVAWEALEHAGIRPDSLAGSLTGVFLGISTADYADLLESEASLATDLYVGTGNSFSIASGRLSYVLGLQGPCMSVDTACSSSLLAVHLAAESLRRKECHTALVAGVNLMLVPGATAVLCRGRMLSFSGLCKTFDAEADGYVRGEGCGVVVLRRLSDALSAGQRILAVVRGSAVNQDGRSSGLTAPNGIAQEALLRAALKSAGIAAAQVGYVEAHGTGTPLGDPIEMRAIASVLGEGRPADRPLLVGSAKTNIGHLEAAAGIAGFIKAVLALHHGQIPPHLHLQKPNPHIAWSEIPIRVPTELQAWPDVDGPRVAGVSSFGFSGTNTHVILEAAPPSHFARSTPDRPLHVVPISARSEAALDAAVRLFAETAGGGQELPDIAFTAATGRAHFRHRAAAIGQDSADIERQLRAADGGLVRGVAEPGATKIAFLFTGQGSQQIDMGRQLYETAPQFKRALEQCDRLFQPHLGESIIALLYGGETDAATRGARLATTKYTQPALFSVEYALAELWLSWGVKPLAVMGHSLGEYVAACVAGVFNLEDATSLVAARAKLMSALPTGGSMAAVFAPDTVVAKAIAPFASTVSIAAVNGHDSVVISGAHGDVETVTSGLAAQGIVIKPLAVSHAFHSPLMAPMLDEFEAVVRRITFRPPRIRVVSNVTGKAAEPSEITQPAYWRQHIEKPVLFAPSIDWLHTQGFRTFLEIGPQATLVGMAARCISGPGLAWLPSLRKAGQDWEQMLRSLAEFYVHGVDIDWSAFDRGYARRPVSVPTYPFQRQRFWLGSKPRPAGGATLAALPADIVGDPLLGRRVRSPLLKDDVYQIRTSADTFAFLADHLVGGTRTFPVAAYIEMATAGARLRLGSKTVAIDDFVFEAPLALGAESVLQTTCSPVDDGRTVIQIFGQDARSDDPRAAWTRHAVGRAQIATAETDGEPLDEVRRRVAGPLETATFYGRFAERGIGHGPAFQCIEALWRARGESVARLKALHHTGPERSADGTETRLLDAAFLSLDAAMPDDLPHDVVAVPAAIGRLQQHGALEASLWSHARVRPADSPSGTLIADLRLYDDHGRVVWSATGISLTLTSAAALHRAERVPQRDWLYEIDWQAATPPETTAPSGTWLVLADRTGTGDRLAHGLRSAGATVVAVGSADRDQLPATMAGIHGQLTGVVHLWSLDAETASSASVDELERDVEASTGSALALLRGLGQVAGDHEAPRLYVVTRGAVTVREAPRHVQPAQGPLWGLARVIMVEQPQWRCTAIDLDPNDSDGIQTLLKEIGAASDENQVALRGDHRYVARLVRHAVPADPALGSSEGQVAAAGSKAKTRIEAEATYLVTGGCGGLGLKVAEWLAASGARHLVLMSRSAASETAAAVIAGLERHGTAVSVVAGDVSREEDVRRVILGIRSSGRPLRGVVHAAGVLDDGVLSEQTWTRFETVMAAKVRGSWLLHVLTAQDGLDFFVLFSSVSSVLGSPGQGNYAAANGFLDALASYRQSYGLPALSVSWGAWADVGLATRVQSRDRMRMAERGVMIIPPDQGVEVLGTLLPHPAPHVVVMPVQWATLLAETAPPPLFRVIAMEPGSQGHRRTSAAAADEVRRQLADAPASARSAILASLIRTQVAGVLRLDSPDQIDGQEPFTALGIDSLMLVELRNALTGVLGCSLALAALYEHGTVEALTAHLLPFVTDSGNDQQETADPRVAERQDASSLLEKIDSMSDEAVDALLTSMLAEPGARE